MKYFSNYREVKKCRKINFFYVNSKIFWSFQLAACCLSFFFFGREKIFFQDTCGTGKIALFWVKRCRKRKLKKKVKWFVEEGGKKKRKGSSLCKFLLRRFHLNDLNELFNEENLLQKHYGFSINSNQLRYDGERLCRWLQKRSFILFIYKAEICLSENTIEFALKWL